MRPLTLIALSCALQVAAADEPSTARDRMATMFKKEFTFDAEAAAKERERLAQTADADVLVLATVHVRDKAKETAANLEAALMRIEAEKFNWRHGGTIVKGSGGLLSPDLKFKYNPEHNGIDLLNFSW